MTRALALLVAVGAAAGCDRSAPLSPGTPASPAVDGGCAPDDEHPEMEIVACGFAPTLAMIGVDDAAAYVLTEAGSIYRADKATGARTKLYTLAAPLPTIDPVWNGVKLEGPELYFGDVVGTGADSRNDILAIDTTTPTAGQPRIVVEGTEGDPAGAAVVDSDRVYWQTNVETPSGEQGAVVSAPLAGGTPRSLAATAGPVEPLGIVDGKIYFFYVYDSTMPVSLRRVPVGGGDVETVIAALPSTADTTMTALGSDSLYITSLAEPGVISIFRYPFSGDAPIDLFDANQGGEVPAGAPHDMIVDGDFLYFVLRTGYEAYVTRVPLDVGGVASLALPSLFTPVFDDHYLYVTYTRGGSDSPIEGVVARFAR